MKLAIRIFAMSVVFAGVAAASFSSTGARALVNHQSATDRLPVPGCGPHIPTCSMPPSRY